MEEITIKARPCTAPERFYEKPETKEYSAIIDGWLRTWKEYVPSGYDGSKPVPLVLSVHGAAHHSADSYTAWQLVAEREGFIVAYPHCLIEGIKFNSWHMYTAEDGMPDDVVYFDKLIDILEEKYNIDKDRIYLQGQSVGDTMASTYLFERGNRLAAAAPLSGPQGTARFVDSKTGEVVRRPQYPLPVIRTHGSEDTVPLIGGLGKICVFGLREPDVEDYSDEARRLKWVLNIQVHNQLWRETNKCKPLPRIGVDGRYNWLVYDGDPEDYIFYIVEGGEHGPYLDMADNIWRYFFSHYRRENGQVIRVDSPWQMEPDSGAIALADGATVAYVDNQLMPISEDGASVHVEKGLYYVPATFLAQALPGITAEFEQDGQAVRMMTEDGHTLYLAMGNRVAVWDNTLRDLAPVLWLEDRLYVPAESVAALLGGLQIAKGHDVCYLCPSGGSMSYDLAYAIRQILGVGEELSLQECAQLEEQLLAAREAEGKDKYVGGEAKIFGELFADYQRQYDEYVAAHGTEGK
jgi:poly(3-hydroxybutyrate) depolymerase